MKHNFLTYFARALVPKRDKAYLDTMISDFEKLHETNKEIWLWSWAALKLAWRTRIEAIQEISWLLFFLTPKRAARVFIVLLLLPVVITLGLAIQSKRTALRIKSEHQESLALESIFEADACYNKNHRDAQCILDALEEVLEFSLIKLNLAAQAKYSFLKNHGQLYQQEAQINNLILKQAILRNLDMGKSESLTAGHLLEITSLRLNSQEEIDSLVGLDPKTLVNLQELILIGIQISDISPIAKLDNLLRVFIRLAQVSDISPLANLRRLQKLDLHLTKVNDIKPLANLHNLQELNLFGTQVDDINLLTNLYTMHLLAHIQSSNALSLLSFLSFLTLFLVWF